MSPKPSHLALAGLACLTLTVGCGGDITSSAGDLGRLKYSLYTIYEVPEADLKDARIITGHPQRIDVALTSKGRGEVAHPGNITHQLVPSDGVTIHDPGHLGDDETDYVRAARFTVSTAGEYTLESRDNDDLVDKLTLQFETPTSFELSIKVREPWGEDFEPASGDPITVEEGSQVLLLAIPEDASGQRLAGDMTPEISVDPTWAVVPSRLVLNNTEDVTWHGAEKNDYYFIEAATVTFTVSDSVTEASTTQAFEVTPVPR